jgi:hypothetical protein
MIESATSNGRDDGTAANHLCHHKVEITCL